MWVLTADIIHEFLILRLVHDGDDFVPLLHIVCTDRLIDRCSAVQVFYNKPAQFFFLFGDDADTAGVSVLKMLLM